MVGNSRSHFNLLNAICYREPYDRTRTRRDIHPGFSVRYHKRHGNREEIRPQELHHP